MNLIVNLIIGVSWCVGEHFTLYHSVILNKLERRKEGHNIRESGQAKRSRMISETVDAEVFTAI